MIYGMNEIVEPSFGL